MSKAKGIMVGFIGVAWLVMSPAQVQAGPLEDQIAALETKVAALEAKLASVTIDPDPINGLSGPHWIFTGVNVHIRNGTESTLPQLQQLQRGTTVERILPVGRGNLIVGYNEEPGVLGISGRDGDHNVVIGPFHTYPADGGLVAGFNNAITGPSASVSGGSFNTASGKHASVSGGWTNTASGESASVSGGWANTASGASASVSGGNANTASGSYSSVGGGSFNTASGSRASVSGGEKNRASGANASVSGGYTNTASKFSSSVSGGVGHAATSEHNWRAGNLFQPN